MPLIDKTYFIDNEIEIPNTNDPNISARLTKFIGKYEEKFFVELLGYGLSKSFKDGLLLDPIPAIWTNIRDGAAFTSNGKSYRWIGLVDTANKTSPIANYIYYWWMRDSITKSMGIGEGKSKADNNEIVSPGPKMTRAWNEMVDKVWDLVSYLDTNVAIYPDWSWYHNGYTGSMYWRSYNYARLNDIFSPINMMNLC